MAHFMANFAEALGNGTRLGLGWAHVPFEPHAGEISSAIAFFMAQSGMDVRFTLNCLRIAEGLPLDFGSVATPGFRGQFPGNRIPHG